MADQLRRRIRAHQLRECRLQLGIAADQRIIFRVRHLGRIVAVVQPVVPRNLTRQPHQFVGSFGFGHTRSSTVTTSSRRAVKPSVSYSAIALALPA